MLNTKVTRRIRTLGKWMQPAFLVGLLAFLIVAWGQDILGERQVRSALSDRGVETDALITARSVKACFGLFCNDPIYFAGGRGDAGYREFAQRYCRTGSRNRNCHHILTFAFSHATRQHVVSESVLKIRLQELRVGNPLRIKFDRQNPSVLRVVGDSKGEADYYAGIFFAGVALLFLWLGFGVWVHNRRERRGWGTGNYLRGY